MEKFVKRGQILHQGTPFVAMLTRSHIKTHCSYCFAKLTSKHIIKGIKVIFAFTFTFTY
jgi:hypothetical protein